jgi:hypothetical protein
MTRRHEALGWPVRAIADGGHFEMMVRPGSVADALQDLLDEVRRNVHERDAGRAA